MRMDGMIMFNSWMRSYDVSEKYMYIIYWSQVKLQIDAFG